MHFVIPKRTIVLAGGWGGGGGELASRPGSSFVYHRRPAWLQDIEAADRQETTVHSLPAAMTPNGLWGKRAKEEVKAE